MDTSFLQIVSSIILIFIALYIIYLKSYLGEKAKNAATTSDIGRITRIVEETKKEFNTEIELLRSNLNLYGQNFNSIKTLERNALIEINAKYSAWLHSLINFNLVFYSYDYYEPLTNQPFLFNQRHLEFNIAEDSLHLYVHDQEIISRVTELKLATYKLEGSVLTNLTSFITNCKLYNQKKQIAETLGVDKIQEIHKDYHDKQQPIIEKSLTERNEIANQISQSHISFIKMINYRIYQLIQQEN